MDVYFLTQDDLRWLKKLVERERRAVENPLRPAEQEQDYLPPEVFAVEGDMPGDVNPVQVLPDGSEQTLDTTVPVADVRQLAIRDKFGTWFGVGGTDEAVQVTSSAPTTATGYYDGKVAYHVASADGWIYGDDVYTVGMNHESLKVGVRYLAKRSREKYNGRAVYTIRECCSDVPWYCMVPPAGEPIGTGTASSGGTVATACCPSGIKSTLKITGGTGDGITLTWDGSTYWAGGPGGNQFRFSCPGAGVAPCPTCSGFLLERNTGIGWSACAAGTDENGCHTCSCSPFSFDAGPCGVVSEA